MIEYEFDKYDHIDRLDIVMKYREVELYIDKEVAAPYALFAFDKYDSNEYQALCIGASIEEINYKLDKIREILDNNNVKYSISGS